MQFFCIVLQLKSDFRFTMDKTVKNILSDLNSDTKLENEKSIQEIKKKFFHLM